MNKKLFNGFNHNINEYMYQYDRNQVIKSSIWSHLPNTNANLKTFHFPIILERTLLIIIQFRRTFINTTLLMVVWLCAIEYYEAIQVKLPSIPYNHYLFTRLFALRCISCINPFMYVDCSSCVAGKYLATEKKLGMLIVI